MFYFSRRQRLANAEDLAQETLTALLSRDDFEFEREEDFLRVCYGFASRISRAGYRRAQKHAAQSLDAASPAPLRQTFGMNSTEIAILLDEVIRTAKLQLRERDWLIIRQATTADRSRMAQDFNLGDANNVRVHLYRARKKLAKLTGWTKP